MAVENKYVNADVVAGKKAVAAFIHGENRVTMVCNFETAAADDAGSIYRLFKNVPANLIPVSIRVSCDAIAGATDVDLGFYEPLEMGGAVIDADRLADGINISAGYTRILGLDGLTSVDYADADLRLFELAGHTLATRKNGYDIALTMNSEVSAAGTILVIADFVQG